MRPAFSEFSYAFAFIYGLVNDLPGLTSAPTLPSLSQEGQTGYDAKLDYPGLPLFFQYKTADLLTRPQAKYWNYYGKPYLRFDITPRKRSLQHNLLKELADQGEPNVYYAAPLFATTNEFNAAYLADQVCNRSIWLPLNVMPYLTDDDPHHVTYTTYSDPSWHTNEEDLRGEVLRGDFSAEHTYVDIRERFRRADLRLVDRNYIEELRTKLHEIVQRHTVGNLPDFARVTNLNSDGLRDIRYLLTAHFGAELVLLRMA